MLNIRFHGRGGQGIKTAGRILGSALFLAGFEVQDAPRYGAERRGAPMLANVRASPEPILDRGVIRHPDLIVVADDTLVAMPSAGVLTGIQPHSVLLIRSHLSAATWRERLGLNNPLLILPAADTQLEAGELPYLGTLCAAAAARLLGVVSLQNLLDAIRDELDGLAADIIAANTDKARTSYEGFANHAGCVKAGPTIAATDYDRPDWLDMPLDAASVSAPVIHGTLTSVEVKTGLWRTLRPVVDYERCRRCAWLCGSFCPDSAIRINTQGYPEIDYDHCKGCMICLAQCPAHAISAMAEASPNAKPTEKTP